MNMGSLCEQVEGAKSPMVSKFLAGMSAFPIGPVRPPQRSFYLLEQIGLRITRFSRLAFELSF